MQNRRYDYIRQIVDNDSDDLLLVYVSPKNSFLFKLQINIQGSFPVRFNFPNSVDVTLNKPTPAQYAVIKGKSKALKGLLYFLCGNNEEYEHAAKGYEHGAGLSVKEVFVPNVSNTTWPLLHLAIALGQKECFKVLIDFLEDKGELANIINEHDNTQRTPFTIALETGDTELIKTIIEKGVDAFSISEGTMLPLIYISKRGYTDKLEQAIQTIYQFSEDKTSVRERLEKYFYDDDGRAYKENKDGKLLSFENINRKFAPEIQELFNKEFVPDAKPMDTVNQDGSKAEPTQDEPNDDKPDNDAQSNKPAKCCVCDQPSTQYCATCQKLFCETHYNEHTD